MGLSFLRGLIASINPCAFVMLPTYLMYFLGMEGRQPGDQRATVRRALWVAGAVSAGFMAVFVAVGVVSEYATRWIESNAKYATLVIGVGFVVLGVAMLAGYRVAVLVAASRHGYARSHGAGDGVVRRWRMRSHRSAARCRCSRPCCSARSTATAGAPAWRTSWRMAVGMALVVTALTIALAVANTSLLRVLRGGSRYVDRIAAVLVLLSGLYLVYYFWVVDINEDRSTITDRVERLQQRIQVRLLDHWQPVAVVLAVIVVAAAVYGFGAPSLRRLTAPGPHAWRPVVTSSASPRPRRGVRRGGRDGRPAIRARVRSRIERPRSSATPHSVTILSTVFFGVVTTSPAASCGTIRTRPTGGRVQHDEALAAVGVHGAAGEVVLAARRRVVRPADRLRCALPEEVDRQRGVDRHEVPSRWR